MIAVYRPWALYGVLMKTALKLLLLLSASFLSADALAKSQWVADSGQPGVGNNKTSISHLAISADGLTIYVTERFPYDSFDKFWKSNDGGVNWFTLKPVK